MDHAALVIVDVQNDFIPSGSLPVADGAAVVPVINRLMPLFPVVVATKDWHPRGHVSFASSHGGKQAFDSVNVDGIEQKLWPDHCIQGTAGADFHKDLDVRPVDLILHKGTQIGLDSYSAFFENDHKSSTGLAGYLRERSCTRVYVTGLAADVCVYYSAMDALKSGCTTYVVSDATRGIDVPAGSLARSFETMKDAGITIISSSDVTP